MWRATSLCRAAGLLMYLLGVIANITAMHLQGSTNEVVHTTALQLDGSVQANHLLSAK